MFLQADVNKLKLQLEGAAGDVDLLLTCEWPEGVLFATPPGSTPEGLNTSGPDRLTLHLSLHRLCIYNRTFQRSYDCSYH